MNPRNKKFPPNNEINLSRFQLTHEQIKDFKLIISGLESIDNELNTLNSLNIDKRADGQYSERSKKGKDANRRIEELEGARTELWVKKAKYLDKQNKFSTFRFTKNIFNKAILNSITLSIIFTVICLFLVSEEVAKFYGYINISLFVIFSIILFSLFFEKVQKQEEDLHDMVYKYYQNNQKIDS
ncbi:hypothetical protein JCM30760_19710 [Thiomicrorhabdus hydrogeniphila]